jgi:hypothetical protein
MYNSIELDAEYFELRVLERKGLLQERLVNLMLGEQNIHQILSLSPSTNVRQEASHFLQEKVEPVSGLLHAYQQHIMDGSLNTFFHQLNLQGCNCEIYREFYSHFTDEAFRRANGLRLP